MRTQLPYAVSVAVVTLVVGYLPVRSGVSPLLGLIFGAAVLALLLRVFGRPVSIAQTEG